MDKDKTDNIELMTLEELKKFHKKIVTLFDTGDNKVFGMMFANDIGSCQIVKIEMDGEEYNCLKFLSNNGAVDSEFSMSDEGLKCLLLILGHFLDGKTIEKAITTIRVRKHLNKITPKGEIDFGDFEVM